MVGTRVRDRMNEQIMANITASAIGTNRKRATPSRKNIGTNTMQMQSSDTKAGVTICRAPSMIAVSTGLALLEVPVDVLDGDGGVVDQDADGERQAAQGHDVQRLAERRQQRDRAQDGQRNRGGDDHRRAPASEEQQDHQAGQHGGDDRLDGDAADRAFDEQRLVAQDGEAHGIGQRLAQLLDPLLDAVDDRQRRDRAVLQHRSSTERLPSTWTMLVCGGLPSRTCATSRR